MPAVLVRRVVDSVVAGTSRPIELAVADGLPEITVDPDKFTQVVTNLVENAVRHGSGPVRVSLAPVGGADVTGLRLRVEDEGEGISPELRRRVFTKFWKGGVTGGSGSRASTWSTGWSRRTAARSPSGRPTAAVPGSTSSCRPPGLRSARSTARGRAGPPAP